LIHTQKKRKKMLNNDDDFSYSNEAEEEMAQLHALHIHMNAVSDVQKKLAKMAEKPSAEECVECGDEIPVARQKALPGVQLCTYCQEVEELTKGRR
jgi:phage/conjugal plasmid C-4 type zinc finger TraR family protein